MSGMCRAGSAVVAASSQAISGHLSPCSRGNSRSAECCVEPYMWEPRPGPTGAGDGATAVRRGHARSATDTGVDGGSRRR